VDDKGGGRVDVVTLGEALISPESGGRRLASAHTLEKVQRQGRDLRWLDSVRMRGGFRSSHHWDEDAPIRAGGAERWAEFNWYGGFGFQLFDRFDLTMDYNNV
jgi:hypothetical protein